MKTYRLWMSVLITSCQYTHTERDSDQWHLARAGVTITLLVLNKPQPHRNDDQTPGVIIVTVHVSTNAWFFTPIHNFIGTQRYHSQTGCYVDHQALRIVVLRRNVFLVAH